MSASRRTRSALRYGYRWALDKEVTNKVKCRGENELSKAVSGR